MKEDDLRGIIFAFSIGIIILLLTVVMPIVCYYDGHKAGVRDTHAKYMELGQKDKLFLLQGAADAKNKRIEADRDANIDAKILRDILDSYGSGR